MSNARVIYFNWHKLEKEPRPSEGASLFIRVNPCGDFLADHPDLYDYVGDIGIVGAIGEGTDTYIRVCNRAFRDYNRVTEDDMLGKNIRSMCVGDAVLFPDGWLFVCQGCGWKCQVVSASSDLWSLPMVESQDPEIVRTNDTSVA